LTYLFSLLSQSSVSAIDFSVDWAVSISGDVDAVVGIGQDGGQGDKAWSLWPVEHLRFELGELVLQVGEFFGQSFNNAWVDVAHETVIWGTQVL